MSQKSIPAIAPKSNSKSENISEQRLEWERQYSHYLARKNKLAARLLDAGRTLEGSANYKKLRDKTYGYWQLLHDTKPEYTPICSKQ